MILKVRDVRANMPNYPYPHSQPAERKIRRITLHQSGTVDAQGVPFGTARSIFDQQVHALGKPRGCFHYVITPSGRIEYALDESLPGDHNHTLTGAAKDPSELDAGTLSVCLVGWFEDRRTNRQGLALPGVRVHPTRTQQSALVALLAHLSARYGLAAEDIFAHHELDPGCGACPGPNFDTDRIRSGVAALGRLLPGQRPALELVAPASPGLVTALTQLPFRTRERIKTWGYFWMRVATWLLLLGFGSAFLWSWFQPAAILPRLAGLILLLPVLPLAAVLPLRRVDPQRSSFMRLTAGKDRRVSLEHQWVSFDGISPHLVSAACLSEDPEFTRHAGIDGGKVLKALRGNLDGEYKAGGSSITQQLVKNLFLWPSRSILRKILEVWLALLAECVLSKKRILELYLNFAQLDANCFGVEAACRKFFDKPCSQVTLEQACLLMAALPNPLVYKVSQPSEYLRHKQAGLQRWVGEYSAPIREYFYGPGSEKKHNAG